MAHSGHQPGDEQAVSAEGDIGLLSSGQVCHAGSGHLHHQRGHQRTDLCPPCSVSTFLLSSFFFYLLLSSLFSSYICTLFSFRSLSLSHILFVLCLSLCLCVSLSISLYISVSVSLSLCGKKCSYTLCRFLHMSIIVKIPFTK